MESLGEADLAIGSLDKIRCLHGKVEGTCLLPSLDDDLFRNVYSWVDLMVRKGQSQLLVRPFIYHLFSIY